MEASLGASFEGHVEQGAPGVDVTFGELDFYQAGINFYFGNFAICVGGEYYNDPAPGPSPTSAKTDDDYDGVEFGIGTALAF